MLATGAVAGFVAACGGSEPLGPSNAPPAKIEAVTDLVRNGSVGTPSSALTVKVTDASGRPVQGVNVAFAITIGNGSTSPRLVATDSKGQAASVWTLGTIAGTNEVTASVSGVEQSVRFEATGNPGAATVVQLSTVTARLLPNVDTIRINAKALDSFGNATSPAPVFTSRDPTLLSVDANGLVRALKRGSATYVVATAGDKKDSVLVTVLAPGQSLCTGAAAPTTLAVGQVITDVPGAGFCVHADSPFTEYAIVPFYNSPVSSATTSIEVRAQGIAPLFAASLMANNLQAASPVFSNDVQPDYAREARMRAQERTEGAARASAARRWFRAERSVASSVPVLPAIGALLNLNTNAVDYCASPAAGDVRTGRVVAITDKAIIVADTANPAGGFTADEYRSIGVTFDTLVDPLDRKMFGDPSDIDNNGHVTIFFTRAVNELTPQASSSVYLGFFYARDLYPRTGGTSLPCPGSNVAEMFYMLVPDSAGAVNGNKRSKSDVVSYTLGTVAHEYQHLINASRRLYVNGVGTNFEQRWLDEGLAHSAEDLNFWASSKLSPGSNVNATTISSLAIAPAYNTFAKFNTLRYTRYLGRTESQGPVGFDLNDDDLETRGAIWSFLRYAADRLGPAAENSFWFNLVNSKTSGIANLTDALGTAPGPWIRDWAISVFLDDNAVGAPSRFQQPSWNLRSILTNDGKSIAFPLVTRVLVDGGSSNVALVANGASFLRFTVPYQQDALLTVTSGGQPLPPTVLLSVVRVK